MSFQEAEKKCEVIAIPSAAQLRETGEMIRVLEGRVRDIMAEKEKWKAAAKELRGKLDTRSRYYPFCVAPRCDLSLACKGKP